MKNGTHKSMAELLGDHKRVLRAVRSGVRAALIEHKRAGRPIVVWQDGKVVTIPPEKIPVTVPACREGTRKTRARSTKR